MYYYYHVASYGPVWWKHWITIAQLIQFFFLLVHSSHTLIVPNCHYHKFMAIIQSAEAIYFLTSFSRFYYRSYLKKRKSISESKIEKTILTNLNDKINGKENNNNNYFESIIKNDKVNGNIHMNGKKEE